MSADPVVCNPGVTEWRVVVRKSSPDAELRMVCRVKGRFFDVESQEEDELPDGRVQYVLWYVATHAAAPPLTCRSDPLRPLVAPARIR